MGITYRSPRNDKDEVSKVLINRYTKATHNTVVRFERKNLEAVAELVKPRRIEMLSNQNATYTAGYIINDDDPFDQHLVHKGNYVIKDWRGDIHTVNAETMDYLCRKFG